MLIKFSGGPYHGQMHEVKGVNPARVACVQAAKKLGEVGVYVRQQDGIMVWKPTLRIDGSMPKR